MRAHLKNGFSHVSVLELTAGWPATGAAGRVTLLGRLQTGGEAVETGGLLGAEAEAMLELARAGFLVFTDDPAGPGVELVPNRWDFRPDLTEIPERGRYRVARLAYLHTDEEAVCFRHPDGDCFVRAQDPAALQVFGSFRRPADLNADLPPQMQAIARLLVRAGVLQSCDGQDRGLDESDPVRRQWELHDAIFQSRSRAGRTDQRLGATWRFQGEIDQQPAVKPNPWPEQAILLPRPDLNWLFHHDVPLTAALEMRRSVRHNSVVPLSALELGHFLFRTCRIRHRHAADGVEYTSRPYPGGGGLYEDEIYVGIDRCLDLPRGFYYYDAERHALCPVSPANADLEGLLEDARMATAGICRPQILLTIASRHGRFSWKYSGMALAAQLKNVGVIYQTMYLVATAMNLGGCALGLGNTDRFLKMAGTDWFSEGSVGEFILGRPL